MLNKEYVIKELKKHIDVDVFGLLKECGCIIAGGAFTSILTNKEVNDIDVYFKSHEDFITLLNQLKASYCDDEGISWGYVGDFDMLYLGHTDKSLTFQPKHGDVKIQFIHQAFYAKPKHIFRDFDFTINMFAYDLSNDKFVYHKDAMQHLAQRVLVTNGGTKFPMMSVLRVHKYESRGYKVSKKEMMKLLIAINSLNIDSYEALLQHMGGMYSMDLSKIFNQGEEFSLEGCIEQLCELEVDPFAQWNRLGWDDFLKFVEEQRLLYHNLNSEEGVSIHAFSPDGTQMAASTNSINLRGDL